MKPIRSILSIFSIVLFINSAYAQVVLTLDYQAIAGTPASIPSGTGYTMQLNYAVSSTTGSASGVKIVVNLPDNVFDTYYYSFVGTVHAPASNFVFDGTVGAKKLTITFIDPVPSGSTGVLSFEIFTMAGTSPNNTSLQSCATMTDASGATSGAKCHTMTLTAQSYFCASKTLVGGGALDNPTVYDIIMNNGNGIGNLDLTNVILTDTYPANAELVSVKVFGDYNADITSQFTINQSGNSFSIPLGNYGFTRGYGYWASNLGSRRIRVTLKYNSSAGFTAGQSATNSATVTYTPLGGSSITATNGSNTGCANDLIETLNLTVATPAVAFTKSFLEAGYSTTIYPNHVRRYGIELKNTGNVALENVEIIENIPSGITLVQSLEPYGAPGTQYNQSVAMNGTYTVEYQTNTNTNWRVWGTATGFLELPAALVSGEYITKLKVKVGTVLPNSAANVDIAFKANATNTTVNINNCAEWTSTTANIPVNRTVCNNQVNIEPTPSTARMLLEGGSEPYKCPGKIGDIVPYYVNVIADKAYAALQQPVVAFVLPNGAEFVANSQLFDPLTSNLGSPTFTIIPNYNGSGNNLYRFTFPTGSVLQPDTRFSVSIKVKYTNNMEGNTDYSSQMRTYATGNNVSVYSSVNYNLLQTYPDTYDWDGDGNTTEIYTGYNNCFQVQSSTSMESIKWVKGLCDTEYSKYPNYGQTVPGGNADYKLIVKNTGNVTMKDIKIIDILPFIGDKGVIDPQARLTAWTPNLADPISAPAGITVYYSTSGNPCRDEVKGTNPSPFPTGCETPNWTTTPPANITAVKSVKIDFGTKTLAGGDSLVFSWPMRAPVSAPTNNEIAWNSFGFVATRTDNNLALIAAEPNKVGIKVKAGAPAYYGNRVWYDTNHDGIQDASEGGVDGVKVKLFKVSSLSATPNPATDQLINFTITGNGGYYKFSNLASGFYYAVFCLTNEYQISPKNKGTNTNDSDGSPTTYLGQTATITAVTELVDTEDDDSWDQGIYCNITPTASSNSPVQEGGTLNLIASGGGSYYWSGPNGWAAIGATVSKTNVTLADTGIYSVNIFDLPDGAGCYATLIVKVKSGVNTCNITSSCTSIPVTSCLNVNGGASVSISGELGNTTYLWSNGETTNTISNKPAGTYSVTVTDDILSGCSTSCQVVIADNTTPPSVVCTPTQPTCSNPQGGSVQANITGGTAPITYIWNNGNSNSSISNLGAGTYSVTVTDNNGCKSNCSTVLSSPTNCCTIQSLGLVISSCNNKGSLTNSSDDEFSFTLNPSGSGIGTTYIVNGLPNSPQIGNYGSPTSFGPYLISNGVLSISIVDNSNNNCTFSGSVTPPMSCSVCDLIPPTLSVVDNVCPSRTGSIQVIQNCSPTAFEQFSINNGNTWTNIKPIYNSTPRTIFARCVNKLDTTCKSQISKITTAPKYCPPSTASECSITAVASIDPCNDNKTNDDKSDDFFTIQINATALNEGSSNKFEVVIGADLFTGVGGNVLNTGGTTYGTPIIIGQNKIFVANNTTSYQLVIRDINNNNCFQKVDISPVAPCSIAPPKTKCYPIPCIPIQLNKN